MLTHLPRQLKRAGRWLPVALLLPVAAHAQFNYAPRNATNVAGTYTDLGTTGTAIATANTDDDNSAAQPIGFTFSFNGTAFTQFVLNTNGFLKLGATAPSAVDLFLPEAQTATQEDPIYSADPANVNIVAPFNFDLTAGSAAGGAEYRVATTGTAPNRVCTIQWKNVADKTLAYDRQYGSMSFQAKLYETTNNIEFVYGPTTQGPNPDDYRFAVVGIKGSSTNVGELLLANKTASADPWSSTAFIASYYSSSAHNYRGTVPPDAGRTYRFAAVVVPPPTYATLPYTESFENTWASVRATNDVPTANWLNAPISGDNSWRRDDDGFTTADWSYEADETGPNPPYTIKSSTGTHSARFHSFGADAGFQGKLDLYVNLGGTGSKTLTFDYVNPTGTDKLDVLVSTDGGATFAPTPALTLNTAAAFTSQSVSIPGNSATTVIRFLATSDFGDDDLGIDNLRIAVVTATRNAELAAAVSVWPNPAHQRFSVSVPAGSLRTAAATLRNALGQVVATRQLSLPAAGGSTDFDVSRLAAGIYTLSLQAGNDLVVKRVVVE